ncbi:MAG: chloride channel protein, partial [Bacteroidetes bacterium]
MRAGFGREIFFRPLTSMWTRFIQAGKRLLDAFTGWLHKREYDAGLISSVQRWLPYVGGAVLVAGLAVLYEKLFEWAEHFLILVKTHADWLFFGLTPVMFLLGWVMVRRYAPAAGGSGIPQLMVAIDARKGQKRVSTGDLLGGRVLLTKLGSSVAALLGGALIGREGPTIQMSAAIFYVIHKLLPASWPRIERPRMLIAGGAAGLAAAFNTPLGGIVFVIEELTRAHLNTFKSSLLYAVIFAGMTVQWLLGPYLYLGYPKVAADGLDTLLWVVLFSAVAGIAGAYKSKLILAILAWKRRRVRGWGQVWFVLACGLAVGAIIFFNDDVAYGPGKEIMNRYLFNQHRAPATLSLLLSRFFGAILSYSSGVAGGVFATSLTTGSLVGELLMNLLDLPAENKLFILSAMIGFLTGVTRSPFTSSILVLEMTDRHSAIFHFMLAGLVASVAARLVDRRSLYGELAKAYLQPEPA